MHINCKNSKERNRDKKEKRNLQYQNNIDWMFIYICKSYSMW